MKKIKDNTTTITNVIASSGSFDIELIESLGTEDYKSLMEISASLAEDYGEKYILTKNTINKYFNRSGALPIIARFENKIIGYIIGMPLELLSQEPWARLDENYGKFNTLYTYAFVIMRQIFFTIFIFLFIFSIQSCSPKPELTPIQKSKKRIPNWIKGVPINIEKWYKVGQASASDSITSEDNALSLMKEKLRLDLENIITENYNIKEKYLHKITKHIMNGRKDLISSLKKIDSSFFDNGINYSLLSISKKDYYKKIAERFNHYDVEKQISLLNDDLKIENFIILSSIIDHLVIHFDCLLIKNNNKKNVETDILEKTKRIINDYNNRITFSFEPGIINSLPITNDGVNINVSIHDNKTNQKLNNINMIQDLGSPFDLISIANNLTEANNIKIPLSADGNPYSFTIKIDYETILNTPFFDFFLFDIKEFKIAVVPSSKKVFLNETIQSVNSSLGESVFNESVKSCFETKFEMVFVNNEDDADLSMFFGVSSIGNTSRSNRKQPFKSEAFLSIKIVETKTKNIILDHIVATQEALNYDFIERASIKALRGLAHESLSAICF
ncbi:hypothetical protein N9S34_02780 [bacterium]|nr:hypothetical protein [bacterium]